MTITTGSAPAALPGGRAMNDNLIKPRKAMGMGEKYPGGIAGGPAPMGQSMVQHPDSGMATGHVMEEGSRGMAPPKDIGPGRMATPSVADHGPHNHRGGKW